MPAHQFLAVDLGAESGRVMLGSLSGDQRLLLDELHRFPNEPVRLPTGLYWDTPRLFREILHGLTVAGSQRRLAVQGIGVDTWGVDFALLAADGSLADLPRHYRDPRTHGLMERTFAVVPREEVFRQTGIQFMPLNTLYQWHAMRLADAPALRVASRLLFTPDLLNYWLTGVSKTERTIASTSQFFNPVENRWATDLLGRLGLDASLLPDVVEPGTLLGPLLPHVAADTGLGPVPVYATAGHDTAAAVAAVPAESGSWCYISSGTWSLMGVETDAPIINEQSLEANYTNELGAGGRVRLLKNIAGLWPVQECRRAWARAGRDYSYDELTRMATMAQPFAANLDPDAFLEPGDMPERIARYCRATGQRPVTDPGEVVRALLEGLALKYRLTLERLERLTGRAIDTIHIVGGGSRNHLLNRFVANATRRRVVAGPTEATAAGNILVQALGAGLLASLAEARAVVRRSLEVSVIEPGREENWDDAFARSQRTIAS